MLFSKPLATPTSAKLTTYKESSLLGKQFVDGTPGCEYCILCDLFGVLAVVGNVQIDVEFELAVLEGRGDVEVTDL